MTPRLRPGARVVVIGSGFIGCEIAATARSLGCEVTVVGLEQIALGAAVGTELGLEIMRRHEAAGGNFALGRTVSQILSTEDGGTEVTGVVLDDGRMLSADTVIEAVGSQANDAWLAGANLNLAGGVETDSAMRALKSCGTAWDNVFAVGDIAKFPNPKFGKTAVAVEHWNIPTETARRAAAVLAAKYTDKDAAEIAQQPFEPIPSFWSDQYESHLLAYGVLAGAAEISLLSGTPQESPVYGYYRDGVLMGVCGLDDRVTINSYRNRVGSTAEHKILSEEAAS